MQQKNVVLCLKHPVYQLDLYININPQSKEPRFYCQLCHQQALKAGVKFDDFASVQEVMESSTTLSNSPYFKNNQQSKQIQQYESIIDKNIENVFNTHKQIIDQTRQELNGQLDQLKSVLKPKIDLFNKLKDSIQKNKSMTNELQGCDANKGADSSEWKQLEQSLEQVLKQSFTGLNLEKQSLDLIDIKVDTSKLHESMLKSIKQTQLQIDECFFQDKIQSQLCPQEFYEEIQQKVGNRVYPLNLLYKMKPDNKNVAAIWQSVNGKARTLFFYKVTTSEIFGGYTPIIWDSSKNGQYLPDDGLISFLFSVTKKQIYPLKYNKQYALYYHTGNVPYFGSSDMVITSAFQITSTLSCYDASAYGNIMQNSHLMNAVSAMITEMEIYQI